MLRFWKGRHASPKRGEKSLGLGRTMLDGRLPEYGPFCPAVTTLTAVNPGLTSRFARWPRSSVYGAKYSYRSPRLMVSRAFTRKSSCAYQFADQLRK